MSKPREVIARAMFYAELPGEWTPVDYEARVWERVSDYWLSKADAVIDALEKMGISPKMDLAACKVSREYELDLQPGDALALWQAMAGAMRE